MGQPLFEACVIRHSFESLVRTLELSVSNHSLGMSPTVIPDIGCNSPEIL